jgi:[acyl-carrier-protein] S-malonyltransferase
MGQALAEAFPIAGEIFAKADQLLNYSISRIAWEGPEQELNDTVNTQPALFVHSIAAMRVFQDVHPGFHPVFIAGHSMGELSALVAARALTFEDGLKLVRIRGESMKQAGEISPGGMAAILGLDIATLEHICEQASNSSDVVQVANDNCPGQVVISGASPALQRAMTLAEKSGARKVVRLAVSIAAHSPLMVHAQERFNQAVIRTPISNPQLPIVGNVNAAPLTSAEAIRTDLQAQLNSRVRWTESIQSISTQGVTTYLEIGSGSVLSGLVKRIDRQARTYQLGTPEDFSNFS